MKKGKKYSDLYIHLVFIIVGVSGIYAFFSMGKVIGLIVGIITLLFEILLVYTSISKIKTKRTTKSIQKSNNYFKNYIDLKEKLNNYNPKDKFGFVLDLNKENSDITVEYINEFQNKYNVILPEILKDYYLKYNKNDIKKCNFYLYGEKYNFCLDFIIPLRDANVNVEKILEMNKNDKYLQTIVPLAEDIGGDNYYWDKKTGKVFYLSMGNVENPIPICDSVEEFFKLLNYVQNNK